MDAQYDNHERGLLSTKAYIEHLSTQLDYPLTYDIFEAGWNDIYVGEVEGIRELMSELKPHYRLAGFSNTNALHQMVWESKFEDVLSHLEEVYSSHTLGHRKPDTESYEAVARELGVLPEEIVFIDDRIENVEGAIQVGMKAIHADSTRVMRPKLTELGVL